VLWARIIPWDKEIAVAALESGVDTLWIPDGCLDEAQGLGRVRTACAEGDFREGRDYRVTEMKGKPDEAAILSSPPETLWVVFPREREVIPLENFVAWRRKILVAARTSEEVTLYKGILEKGAHGIVLLADGPARMRDLATAARRETEAIALVEAAIVKISPLGIGDRVCVDTCTLIEGSRGMLVGDSSAGMFLVCAENAPNPYVLPRPFRVNAGGVHSYCRLPGGRTAYLSELASGAEVLLVNEEGRGETATVGRVKVERRPLLQVRAKVPSGASYSVILQNAETIRLVGPGGSTISMAKLSEGDAVLLAEEAAGRHFGVPVEESIREK
jgi:3-dehydroquinate synthase II